MKTLKFFLTNLLTFPTLSRCDNQGLPSFINPQPQNLYQQNLQHASERPTAKNSIDESSPPPNFPREWTIGAKNMEELGYMFTQSGQGIGIVLGIGPAGKFARHFLKHWTNGILYLCDPFIHIFNGYEDLRFNVDDRTHQLNFENLRTALTLDKTIQGRYSMVREFSFSFFRLWIEKKYELGQHPPRFVYIDNNPSTQAVLRDLRDWWQLLLPGGIIGGGRIYRLDVLEAVKQFAMEVGVKPFLYAEPWPEEKPGGPGWLIMKPNDAEFYDPNMGRVRKGDGVGGAVDAVDMHGGEL